jgi:hypothetical protein
MADQVTVAANLDCHVGFFVFAEAGQVTKYDVLRALKDAIVRFDIDSIRVLSENASKELEPMRAFLMAWQEACKR